MVCGPTTLSPSDTVQAFPLTVKRMEDVARPDTQGCLLPRGALLVTVPPMIVATEGGPVRQYEVKVVVKGWVRIGNLCVIFGSEREDRNSNYYDMEFEFWNSNFGNMKL